MRPSKKQGKPRSETSQLGYKASRQERRRDDIVMLWETPQWQVRKQVVHDFSQAVSGDYMQKTTLDADLQEISSAVNIKIGDRAAIPIEWRPKGLVVSLDGGLFMGCRRR